jgi:hypothetical protein
MANFSLTHTANGFFASVPKSPTQMESLIINNSVMNISSLGTFKNLCAVRINTIYIFIFMLLLARLQESAQIMEGCTNAA